MHGGQGKMAGTAELGRAGIGGAPGTDPEGADGGQAEEACRFASLPAGEGGAW